MSKQSILKKTIEVGGLTGLSRLLGVIREVLLVRFLGIGALSDAFIVAFKIPNFLRKIFAEGALSAAFIPSLVSLLKDKNRTDDAYSLMSVAFLFFEGIVLGLCLLVYVQAQNIVLLMAPGFSAEQVAHATPYLRILFPLILFLSSSALLAGALQSVRHFFVTAFAPVLLNMFFIGSLILCLRYRLSVEILCFGVLLGGLVQFLAHLAMYWYKGLRFGGITPGALAAFRQTLTKFVHCLFGVSVFELNVFVDTQIGSFLPKGSVTLLHYGARFMAIPLGIFAIALSTTLLPHFSSVALYARKRLHFYLLEVTKFVLWVIIPATFFLMFCSEKLFSTLLLAQKGTAAQIHQATIILIVFACGLLFLSLNKVLTNIYYAMHDTWTPTVIGVVSTGVNLLGNIMSLYLAGSYATYGIALSTVVAAATLSGLSFYYLAKKHDFVLYGYKTIAFISKALMQSVVILGGFVICHYALLKLATVLSYDSFFLYTWGYWCIALPLMSVALASFYYTRSLFGIDIYFLQK